MTGHTNSTPRLLPWASPEGKPCFLLPGDGTGYVSRLADRVETEQLGSAAVLVAEARKVLHGRAWTSGELHLLAVELTESLDTVHRVAESRGARLPVADGGIDGDEDADRSDMQRAIPNPGSAATR
ncbi:hypothetical protein GCM10010211_66360 [Streptomyces albospinus]|uniref:Uncharacterized protein n=1 Tax=Streptomyces albospinus TaxID=285515 RepID=A0ABQ2VMR8_9ACTN|nr:hypothetical protein [Streptomyces albospinus]GGU90488.1 hypothetical protein GCM10010211_66360 [Streptomyces albospinus]